MKQKINYTNFEAFYLDFFEGNLSETDRNELLLFLENNPSLKTTLNDLDFHVKTHFHEKCPEQIKENLYQFSEEDSPINASSLSFFQSAYMDGILSAEKQKELESFEKSNEAFSQSAKLFAHTKLAPDFAIVYKDKLKLKKRKGNLSLFNRFIYTLAAACVVCLVIFKYNNTEQTTGSNINRTVKSTPKQIQKIKDNSDTSNFSNSFLAKGSLKVVKKKIVVPSNQIPENHKNQSLVQQTDIQPVIIDSLLENLRIERKEIKQQEEFASHSKEEVPIKAESVIKNEGVTHKRFPLLTKLASKIFHTNIRIAKKSQLKSDVYYLIIGSFQVTRNISK